MRRRSGSRRKRESGGCYQRFRTHHSDEPGSHSSLCRSDEKSCTNNFSASGPFELRFTGGQTVRLTAKRSNLILRTSNGSPPVWAEPVGPTASVACVRAGLALAHMFTTFAKFTEDSENHSRIT